MKRIIAFITLFVIILSAVSCTSFEKSEKAQIIATNFPAYDFARAVAGDAAHVKMLLPTGADSHTYEPSAKDMIEIAECDLFVCVGGESDEWVKDILSSLSGPINTLRMIDVAEPLHAHTHEGEEEYDEHIWTSPENAIKICNSIADALSSSDPDNAGLYRSNANAYTAKIGELDKEFEAFFATLQNKTLVFGDRFPFYYFAHEYGLEYLSPFPGCSEETEPSMATVAKIIDYVKSEKITTVYHIEFSSLETAKAISEATGADIALLHSCHSISADELEAGATYLSLMRANLETLKGTMK